MADPFLRFAGVPVVSDNTLSVGLGFLSVNGVNGFAPPPPTCFSCGEPLLWMPDGRAMACYACGVMLPSEGGAAALETMELTVDTVTPELTLADLLRGKRQLEALMRTPERTPEPPPPVDEPPPPLRPGRTFVA